MIIKSFTADSAAAALKQVRSEMGGDAVVLKTRHVAGPTGSKRIEVTACLDKVPAAPTPTAERRVSTPRWKPVSSEPTAPPVAAAPQAPTPTLTPEMLSGLMARFDTLEAKLESLATAADESGSLTVADPMIEALEARLTASDVPEIFRSVFLSTVARELAGSDTAFDDAQKLLTESLADLMQPQLSFGHGDVVVFVGSAGTGKTSLLGKLAAQLVMTEKKHVRLLSLDSSKVGAHDEIESYAAILGIDVADASETEGVSDPGCVTLIDSSAVPTTVEAFAEYSRRLDTLKTTHRIAVFSALTRTADVTRQARHLRVLSPTHFAFSMLDLTTAHGAVVAAAEALSVKLALLTDSAGGLGKANAPDPLRLAEQLLATAPEVSHE